MQVKFTVKPSGEVITEVLDRQGENCNNIHQITQKLGEELLDERTGPDCDEVHEDISG